VQLSVSAIHTENSSEFSSDIALVDCNLADLCETLHACCYLHVKSAELGICRTPKWHL